MEGKWVVGWRATYVHVDFTREQLATRRVQQQHSLDEIQRRDEQQVVGAVVALAQQALQRADQPHRDVPLEAIL